MERKTRAPAWLRHALVAVLWLAIWSAAALWMGKPLLLPGPVDTLRALADMVKGTQFWHSVLYSLIRIMLGYLAAVLVGTALAFTCHFIKWVDLFLAPLRTVIRTTPVTSFIILVLLWLSNDVTPAFISFLMVVPMLWTSVQEGLAHTDADLLEMTHCYRYTPWKRLVHLYLPSVLPHFTAACANGLGFAWKSGIAAEVIAKPAWSIGKNLQDAKVYLETPQLFAWTLVVILLSLIFEKLLKTVLKTVKVREGGRS